MSDSEKISGPNVEIAQRVRALADALGWTQGEIVRRAGARREGISKVWRGHSKFTGGDIQADFATAFRVSREDLVSYVAGEIDRAEILRRQQPEDENAIPEWVRDVARSMEGTYDDESLKIASSIRLKGGRPLDRDELRRFLKDFLTASGDKPDPITAAQETATTSGPPKKAAPAKRRIKGA